MLERGLDLCRVWNIQSWLPDTASALACAYAFSSRIDEALPLLEQAEQLVAPMAAMGGQSLRVGYLSEAYLLVGRMEKAVQLAEHALAPARDRKERGYQAWALRLLGEIAAHQDHLEVETAEHHYRQALALAEELAMRPLQAHCHLGLGTLYLKKGRREQAHTELSAANEMYRSMDMTFWLPQAEATLARAGRDNGLADISCEGQE